MTGGEARNGDFEGIFMIRFLDLTNDIWGGYEFSEEEKKEIFEFAWYDTCTCKILSFYDENVWSSWKDFESDFLHDVKFKKTAYSIDRFKNLFIRKEKNCLGIRGAWRI